MILELEDDAFADAQIASKIEMCFSIERAFLIHGNYPARIDVYAGWYGILSFLLMSRTNIDVGKIRSFDIDPKATQVANRLNRHFMISAPIFQAFTYDVNKLKPESGETDMIINTAVEHMAGDDWFKNIPSGTFVGIQGTDLEHPNEVVPNPIESLSHLMEKYPLDGFSSMGNEPVIKQIDFCYPAFHDTPGMKFSRFQMVGVKR